MTSALDSNTTRSAVDPSHSVVSTDPLLSDLDLRRPVARWVAVGGVLILALAGCADQPVTPRQDGMLRSAKAEVQDCVRMRMDRMSVSIVAAPRAIGRSLIAACRAERQQFEDLAVSILGSDQAEDELVALDAWTYNQVRRQGRRY